MGHGGGEASDEGELLRFAESVFGEAHGGDVESGDGEAGDVAFGVAEGFGGVVEDLAFIADEVADLAAGGLAGVEDGLFELMDVAELLGFDIEIAVAEDSFFRIGWVGPVDPGVAEFAIGGVEDERNIFEGDADALLAELEGFAGAL